MLITRRLDRMTPHHLHVWECYSNTGANRPSGHFHMDARLHRVLATQQVLVVELALETIYICLVKSTLPRLTEQAVAR
jgi:hypothetical protein